MNFFAWSSIPDGAGDPDAHEWAEFNLPADARFIPEPPRLGFVDTIGGLSPRRDRPAGD